MCELCNVPQVSPRTDFAPVNEGNELVRHGAEPGSKIGDQEAAADEMMIATRVKDIRSVSNCSEPRCLHSFETFSKESYVLGGVEDLKLAVHAHFSARRFGIHW